MAAYCHPRPGGGRFNAGRRGAWYASRRVETALAESTYHRTRELAELGAFETRMQMRLYLADFRSSFHDVRTGPDARPEIYAPEDYSESQKLGEELLASGSNGVLYRSVRDKSRGGGDCICCFRPKLVRNVRVGGYYEYAWDGSPTPRVRKLE